MKIQRHIVAAIVTVLGLGFGPNLSFAEGARTDNQIAYYQQLLTRNPRNSKAYYGLGDALIRKAREIGDRRIMPEPCVISRMFSTRAMNSRWRLRTRAKPSRWMPRMATPTEF